MIDVMFPKDYGVGVVHGKQIYVNHRQKIMSQGFTLIEFMVVMVIICMLAAMLSPALVKSLEQVKSIACQNNQRQIGMIHQEYINENYRWLIWGARPLGNVPTIWESQNQSNGSLLPTAGFEMKKQQSQLTDGYIAELNSMLGQLFTCPCATVKCEYLPSGSTYLTSPRAFSYGFNRFILQAGAFSEGGIKGVRMSGKIASNVSRIGLLLDIYIDADTVDCLAKDDVLREELGYPQPRHNLGENVLLLDGRSVWRPGFALDANDIYWAYVLNRGTDMYGKMRSGFINRNNGHHDM